MSFGKFNGHLEKKVLVSIPIPFPRFLAFYTIILSN